jgi:hypothetical protein
VTRGYTPGPQVAMFVPVNSSSSKHSQVPESMISEAILWSYVPSRRMSPTT